MTHCCIMTNGGLLQLQSPIIRYQMKTINMLYKLLTRYLSGAHHANVCECIHSWIDDLKFLSDSTISTDIPYTTHCISFGMS